MLPGLSPCTGLLLLQTKFPLISQGSWGVPEVIQPESKPNALTLPGDAPKGDRNVSDSCSAHQTESEDVAH